MQRPLRKQRGAAALIVTLMLFLVLALALVYANRTLLADSRSARDQTQTGQAFEAAEAGVAWMTALLDDPHPLDDSCRATSLASAPSMRDRLLEFDLSTGLYLPRTWLDGGTARPMLSACASTDGGWQCSCPSTGLPHVPTAVDGLTRPSFLVSLQAGTRPGTVQVTAIGCSNRAPACVPGSAEPAEAKAQVQTLLGLLPALFAPPAAVLTAQGDVTAPAGASPGFVNTDASSGGATVDAGGMFLAPGARLAGMPGALPALSVVEGDHALRELAADRLFARHFGMDKATWRQRPDVTRIACSVSCGPQIDAALSSGASLLWVDGDLTVDDGAAWGTPSKPVIVVATGRIRIESAAVFYGVIYGQGIAWNGAGLGTASLQGALMSEAGYGGDGSPDLIYDASILRTLNLTAGSFVRVPGSWKDF